MQPACTPLLVENSASSTVQKRALSGDRNYWVTALFAVSKSFRLCVQLVMEMASTTMVSDQYGWVRVKMMASRRNHFAVVDYAYGDPGEPVFAGQTGTNTSRRSWNP